METKKLVRQWGERVLTLRIQDLEDDRGPLIHLEECYPLFDLQPLPVLRFEVKSGAQVIPVEPSFKHVTPQALVYLRKELYETENTERVSLWAERLMRFCEVRYGDLYQRARQKGLNKTEAQLLFLQIAAFLLDFYQASGDLRFLNTVLKLNDLGWILQPRRIAQQLGQTGVSVLIALFQVRLIIVSEYAMQRLGCEKTPGRRSSFFLPIGLVPTLLLSLSYYAAKALRSLPYLFSGYSISIGCALNLEVVGRG